jgi:RHS repeat-associated protein
MHIAKISGADTTWYHGDALGSTRKMTKEDGTGYDWAATYYPFGKMTQTGNGVNTHSFTGKEYDTEMGLNYFCLRYYDPPIGRFITLDPFGGYVELPHSQNRYAYVMNNPLKYIDPLGLYEDPGGSGTPEDPIGPYSTITYTGEEWYSVWYCATRLRNSGQIDPGRPIPTIPATFEDLVYLHLVPGWTVDENGNVVRILPLQSERDRPHTFPWVPSPSLGQILDYREIYTRARITNLISDLENERQTHRAVQQFLTITGGVITGATVALMTGGAAVPTELYLLGSIVGVGGAVQTWTAPPGTFSTQEKIGSTIGAVGSITPKPVVGAILFTSGVLISDFPNSSFPMSYPHEIRCR